MLGRGLERASIVRPDSLGRHSAGPRLFKENPGSFGVDQTWGWTDVVKQCQRCSLIKSFAAEVLLKWSRRCSPLGDMVGSQSEAAKQTF